MTRLIHPVLVLVLLVAPAVWLAACSLERPPDEATAPVGGTDAPGVSAPDTSAGAVTAADVPGAVTPGTDRPGGATVTDPRRGRTTGPETFADFFAVFREDTTFQRTRIAPGFVASSPNPMGDGSVQGRTYIPHSLRFDGGESIRESFVAGGESHASMAAVPSTARTVEFRLDGTDNGIAIGYRFTRGADGRWQLARIDDASQ